MRHKFILALLIVLFVISTSLCGLGFYYDEKNNKELDNKIDNDKLKEVLECTFDGELVQGAEYVNGQYTYRYMQEYHYLYGIDYEWQDIHEDGWGVILTDKESTAPVTTKLCYTINGKPIVSMSYMFDDSNATEIDLSSFDTSNVINMSGMFYGSSATKIDLSNFNTSNVKNMISMFELSHVLALDLSSFDTSKVTDMSYMFRQSSVKELDLSSFNTSNVTQMDGMFSDASVTKLDLSSFDTHNVIDMHSMFQGIKTKKLDLSNFDTSNVTNMYKMFVNSSTIEIVGLNKFNTGNVEDMGGMFANSSVTKLDLSSFDTFKVVDMSAMFANSKLTEIKGLENFYTREVVYMDEMFAYLDVEIINVSSFNTENVETMNGMFAYSKATEIKGLENFDTSNVEDMRMMFKNSNVDKLDLSSFNLSNIKTIIVCSEINDNDKYRGYCLDDSDIYVKGKDNVFGTYGMFEGVKATVGYARTQADADKLNQSGDKPSNLNFIVKQ